MSTQSERAAASRMTAELSGILRSLRHEMRAPAMMATGLDAAMTSVGAGGAGVIRGATSAEDEADILHRAGMIGFPAVTAAMLLMRAEVGTPALSQEPN